MESAKSCQLSPSTFSSNLVQVSPSVPVAWGLMIEYRQLGDIGPYLSKPVVGQHEQERIPEIPDCDYELRSDEDDKKKMKESGTSTSKFSTIFAGTL